MADQPTTASLVDRVRVILEAADRADFDAILAFYAVDAVWDMPEGMGTFEGPPASHARLGLEFGPGLVSPLATVIEVR